MIVNLLLVFMHVLSMVCVSKIQSYKTFCSLLFRWLGLNLEQAYLKPDEQGG